MLNLDSRTRSKLVWVATLLAPVLVVQGVRVVGGTSTAPDAAAAATNVLAPTPPPVGADLEKPATPAQARATTWLLSRTHSLQVRSPMDRPDPAPIQAPVSEVHLAPVAHPAPAPVEALPTNLVLTGMIAGGSEGQSLASINHRVYRIGDTVAPKWKVSAIDTRKRVVTLSGPDGATLELKPVSAGAER